MYLFSGPLKGNAQNSRLSRLHRGKVFRPSDDKRKNKSNDYSRKTLFNVQTTKNHFCDPDNQSEKECPYQKRIIHNIKIIHKNHPVHFMGNGKKSVFFNVKRKRNVTFYFCNVANAITIGKITGNRHTVFSSRQTALRVQIILQKTFVASKNLVPQRCDDRYQNKIHQLFH